MITLKEIQAKQQSREVKRKEVFQIILEDCGKLIKKSDDMKRMCCMFVVPDFVIGQPLFDLHECISFLVKEMKARGFSVHYIFPKSLFITWQSKRTTDERKSIKN